MTAAAAELDALLRLGADELNIANASLRLGDRALPPPGTIIRWEGRKGTFRVLYYSTDRTWIVFRSTTPLRRREAPKQSRRLEGLFAQGFEVVELSPLRRRFDRWERLR